MKEVATRGVGGWLPVAVRRLRTLGAPPPCTVHQVRHLLLQRAGRPKQNFGLSAWSWCEPFRNVPNGGGPERRNVRTGNLRLPSSLYEYCKRGSYQVATLTAVICQRPTDVPATRVRRSAVDRRTDLLRPGSSDGARPSRARRRPRAAPRLLRVHDRPGPTAPPGTARDHLGPS